VRAWSPSRLARAAGARILSPPAFASGGGPERVTIDSRDVRPGDLFVGLRGERVDGGTFARAALEAGAWGVLVGPGHAGRGGRVLEADDPLAALQALAVAWRRELGADVIGVTGSTGKTSTKDLLAAMVATDRRVTATAQNLNTEIGLPLTILGAPEGTEVLVLEMAMRGAGQIAELVAIAEPDVGLITNVGPVHLEQLGTLEAIAAEKAGVIAGLRPGGTAVVPAGEPLLAPHLRVDVRTVTFGPGGDVEDLGDVELPFASAHMTRNGLAALAAARAVGVEPGGPIEVLLSARRGQRVELPGPVLVLDDCYNANPMSMRAALDHLAASVAERRVAVLGTMAELGPDSDRYHREIGAHARALGIDVLMPVGAAALPYTDGFDGETHPVAGPEEAGALLEELARPGDRVLIKGSRSVGLERVLG
jgi:UDP-N-acetylmuramoyl-tripeptide--D-alanyl-D-alanine ligase